MEVRVLLQYVEQSKWSLRRVLEVQGCESEVELGSTSYLFLVMPTLSSLPRGMLIKENSVSLAHDGVGRGGGPLHTLLFGSGLLSDVEYQFGAIESPLSIICWKQHYY